MHRPPLQPGSQVKSVSDIGAVDFEPLCIVTPTTHRSQPRLGYDHASLSGTLSRKDVTLLRLLKLYLRIVVLLKIAFFLQIFN